MSRSSALARASLSGGRWLLPWLSVLLVSASLAFAMSTTMSGSRATRDGQSHEISLTRVAASRFPVDAATEAPDDRALGRSCASLFGSYNGWLYSTGGHGACGLEPNVGQGPPADR